MHTKNNTATADRQLSTIGLATTIVERLAAEGITTMSAWCALGRKRLRIFGITTATVRQIDQLAREALR